MNLHQQRNPEVVEHRDAAHRRVRRSRRCPQPEPSVSPRIGSRPRAVVAALGSDAARGLTQAEAQRRLEQYGPNQLKSAPETPWWTRLLEQFQNFLVIILLVRHRHLDGRVAAAGPARDRAALRGDRHPADRRAQRPARLLPGGARGELGARADGARRARIDGGSRRRAPAHRCTTRSSRATSCWSRPATRSRPTPASSRAPIFTPTRRR